MIYGHDYYESGVETGRRFYVYVYLDSRKEGNYLYGDVSFTNEPFYVGKGQGSRYKTGNKQYRNTFVKRKLSKVVPIILFKTNLTEQEAFTEEIRMIGLLGRVDLKTGPLCNLTNGGEGPSGCIASEERKRKISESKLGKPRLKETIEKMRMNHVGMNGKRHSEETKHRMREKALGHPFRGLLEYSEELRKKLSLSCQGSGNGFYGKTHSEETKQNMSITRKELGNTESFRKKMSDVTKGTKNPNYGKHHSEETKQKIREKALGRILSDETKKKISVSGGLVWKKRKTAVA